MGAEVIMANSTKDRILEEALICFAENGYQGTNMRELAARLGLSKSALYKHYESKEEIWNAMFARLSEYYNSHFDHNPPSPRSCEELLELTMKLVNFTIHDQKIILIRRLISSEQFRNESTAALATEYFLNGTKRTFTVVFKDMIDRGLIRQDDPEMLAFAYTSPISALIHQSDRQPEKEPEIMKMIEAFAGHFIETYRA